MTTLKIDETKARKLFTTATTEFKEMLIDSFGKEFFSQKITDRIKSYEDACADLGLDPVESLPFKNPKNNRQEAENAFHMLDVITESLLEGKKLDWEDSDQRKWYPVFSDYSSDSGFRFMHSDNVWTRAYAYGGARLCVDTQEKADYLGTQFLPIWNKFLNPIK
jgi:hypothetical protein